MSAIALKEQLAWYSRAARRLKNLTWLDVEQTIQYTVERRFLRILGWITDPRNPESVNKFVCRDTVPLRKEVIYPASQTDA